MCRTRVVPIFGGLLTIFASTACVPIDETEGSCLDFAQTFQSVSVNTLSLEKDYHNKPLPDELRRLEAGYHPSCVVGGVSDIIIQCPTDKDIQSFVIIRNAPVIWTDPEGFTVVVVSDEDYEKLEGQNLFWARCGTGT